MRVRVFSPDARPSDPYGQWLCLLLLNNMLMCNKTSLIHDLIKDEMANLVCITKTWMNLEDGIPLLELFPPGF